MKRYTGIEEGEIFVGNWPTIVGIPEYLRHLKTARLGEQAFDIEGKELDPSYMRPLLIAASDAAEFDRIMTTRCLRINRGRVGM